MTVWEFVVAAVSGLAAGAINALAGGGTLVSFPALIALGVPPVSANITNTVALVPGYLGGAWAQRRDLLAYVGRLPVLAAVSAVGGLAGSILLVSLPEDLFSDLVPFLILAACLLLAVQDRVRTRVQATRARRGIDEGASAGDSSGAGASSVGLVVSVGIAAVYGGYFGAGLGIMLLAVLGLSLEDPLPRLNSLKSALSLIINLVAAVFFLFSDHVLWDFAAVLAVASIIGGLAGGRLAGRLSPRLLRAVAITVGIVVAVKSAL